MVKILLIALGLFSTAALSDGAPARHAEVMSTQALACPPPGTCAKASVYCRRGDEVPWCDILKRCMDCQFPESQ